MTWGETVGFARFHPAKLAYGGAHGYDEERAALETSLEAGVNLFDTAAMYRRGAPNDGSGNWPQARRGGRLQVPLPIPLPGRRLLR